MKSLFNKTDNDELIGRINRLEPSSAALWGKMNVSQMLAHCQYLFKITYGELMVRRSIAGHLFGASAKRQLMSSAQFKKNSPTFKEARVKDSRDFQTERDLLINYVSRMAAAGPDTITQHPHPFYGKLNITEWDALHYKHMDHHLRQFGV